MQEIKTNWFELTLLCIVMIIIGMTIVGTYIGGIY